MTTQKGHTMTLTRRGKIVLAILWVLSTATLGWYAMDIADLFWSTLWRGIQVTTYTIAEVTGITLPGYPTDL